MTQLSEAVEAAEATDFGALSKAAAEAAAAAHFVRGCSRCYTRYSSSATIPQKQQQQKPSDFGRTRNEDEFEGKNTSTPNKDNNAAADEDEEVTSLSPWSAKVGRAAKEENGLSAPRRLGQEPLTAEDRRTDRPASACLPP